MSQYSRYTTPKGQLLLNIKPPSNRNQSVSPPGSKLNQSPLIESKYVPYNSLNSGIQNLYQPQPISSQINNNIQVSYQQPNNSQIYYPNRNQVVNSAFAIQNQNQNPPIYYQQPTNTNIPQPLIPQPIYYSSNTTKVQPQPVTKVQPPLPTLNPSYNQTKLTSDLQPRPFSQAKTSSKNIGKVGQTNPYHIQSKKKPAKVQNQIDNTVCCFPGYWLLLLALAFMVGCFFLITTRSQQGLFGVTNSSTDTIAAAHSNQSSSKNADDKTTTNKNAIQENPSAPAKPGEGQNASAVSGDSIASNSNSSPVDSSKVTPNNNPVPSENSNTSKSSNAKESSSSSNSSSVNQSGQTSVTTTNIIDNKSMSSNASVSPNSSAINNPVVVQKNSTAPTTETTFQFAPISSANSTLSAHPSQTRNSSNTNIKSDEPPMTSFMFPPTTSRHHKLRHQLRSSQIKDISHKVSLSKVTRSI